MKKKINKIVIEKGLDEEKVKLISSLKNEPK